MINHICFMEAKSYGGSWGVSETKEKAEKIARKALGQKPAKKTFHEVDVPEGRKLIVRALPNGIEWHTIKARGADHTHLCEHCGQPWDCDNGEECDLDDREGHCDQHCHDHNK